MLLSIFCSLNIGIVGHLNAWRVDDDLDIDDEDADVDLEIAV